MYIGTYTKQDSKGIYVCHYDASGQASAPKLAAESSNPSFLAIHPNRRFLYAVNENTQGDVTAFSIGAGGNLASLNSVSSHGADPCHLALDASGKWLFIANYTSGSVAVLPVAADGKLGEASDVKQHHGSSVNKGRQDGPHAHMAAPSPDGRYLLVPDLGMDQVLVYRFDPAKGVLSANNPPFLKTTPGFGPRHLAFGKDAHFVYVLGELTAGVTVFRYDAARGAGEAIQTVSMLPGDYSGAKSGAEITVDASGKFLYASNRVHNSIAIFRIDAAKGTLTEAGRTQLQVKTPRNFAIDPTGAFLLAEGQDSGRIARFRIGQSDGSLTPAGDPINVPSPVCITYAEPA
jgi:6-phosphogluconolactonase